MKNVLLLAIVIGIYSCGDKWNIPRSAWVGHDDMDTTVIAAAKQIGYNECEIKWKNWITKNQDSVIKIMRHMNKDLQYAENREVFLHEGYQSILSLYLNYPSHK